MMPWSAPEKTCKCFLPFQQDESNETVEAQEANDLSIFLYRRKWDFSSSFTSDSGKCWLETAECS